MQSSNQNLKNNAPSATNKKKTAIVGWQGPLPPPSVLQGYDSVVSGAAERILAMAEKEQSHRHSTETATVEAQLFYTRVLAIADSFVRLFGFLFLAASFGASLYFALQGDAKLAAIFFSPFVVVALVKLIAGVKEKGDS
nr:MAG TPA: putative membrane protein [Caudoviricetes sp.]